MCLVSNIGDTYTGGFRDRWPHIPVQPWNPFPTTQPYMPQADIKDAYVSLEDFMTLKREIEQLKKDLEEAKRQDIANGEPDCEMEEKIAFLKKIADLVGVDLSTVFAK